MDVEQKTLSGERQKLADLLGRLEGELPMSSHELHAIWDARARPFWRVQPRIYRALAEKCRRAGENFLAIEAAEEGLAWFNEDLHPAEYLNLVHVRALAYASVGSRDLARELVESLGSRKDDSFLALHLLARAHQDWFETTDDDNARREHLVQARDAYLQALAREPAAQLAVNAAAASLLLDTDQAGGPPRAETLALARQARQLCVHEHARTRYEDEARAAFERLAVMASSSLILGEFNEARELYRQAGELGSDRRSDLLTTRKQARLLLGAHGRDPHEFDGCFPLPNVALFVGHLFDRPGRPGGPRLPEANADRLGARIAQVICEHNILVAYGSAAGGADLLFLREVLARPGGEVHIVLPFAREEFRRRSVVRVPGQERWGVEFDRALAAAASVTVLGDSPCWFDENAYAFCNRVLYGMAARRAREFGDELRAFAIWDGQAASERPGGTAECVRQWAARGCQRVLIPPDGGELRLESHRGPELATTALPVTHDTTAVEDGSTVLVREEIHAVLSGEWEPPADATRTGARPWLVGVGSFFVLAAACLEAFGTHLVHRWVDGPRFRLVFDDLDVAGRAALALRDEAAGPGRLRLGLHAGPVMRWPHPLLLSREEPAGIHLQKANRLAAIPWCGRIRASREYVALLEAIPIQPGLSRLHCIYQGIVPLGEPFDRQELFIVTS